MISDFVIADFLFKKTIENQLSQKPKKGVKRLKLTTYNLQLTT